MWNTGNYVWRQRQPASYLDTIEKFKRDTDTRFVCVCVHVRSVEANSDDQVLRWACICPASFTSPMSSTSSAWFSCSFPFTIVFRALSSMHTQFSVGQSAIRAAWRRRQQQQHRLRGLQGRHAHTHTLGTTYVYGGYRCYPPYLIDSNRYRNVHKWKFELIKVYRLLSVLGAHAHVFKSLHWTYVVCVCVCMCKRSLLLLCNVSLLLRILFFGLPSHSSFAVIVYFSVVVICFYNAKVSSVWETMRWKQVWFLILASGAYWGGRGAYPGAKI